MLYRESLACRCVLTCSESAWVCCVVSLGMAEGSCKAKASLTQDVQKTSCVCTLRCSAECLLSLRVALWSWGHLEPSAGCSHLHQEEPVLDVFCGGVSHLLRR
jgi:hypothetical protein